MKALFMISLLLLSLYSQSYLNLHSYKGKYPSKKQEKRVGSFLVSFKDINSFDFLAFEQKYEVELEFCIADGICAFKPKSYTRYEQNYLDMKKRKDLDSVTIYKKYNMKAY